MSDPSYLVVWRPPKTARPTALQTCVCREVLKGTLTELAEVAQAAKMRGDLADEAGVYVGHVDAFGDTNLEGP
jgi:hypothetical protein